MQDVGDFLHGLLNTLKSVLGRDRKGRGIRSGMLRAALKPRAPISADAVTGSVSGLDPHISPDSAQAQVTRVGNPSGIPLEQVNQLVARFAEGPIRDPTPQAVAKTSVPGPAAPVAPPQHVIPDALQSPRPFAE